MNEVVQPLTFEVLRDAVKGGAAAIRIVTRLEPAGGPGDKVFPPTYEGGQYATELRRVGDQEIHTVLLDSVQSQANRMELALLAAYDRREISFPLLVADFSESFSDVGRITALQAPHRVFDAIFRDSLLGGKPFRKSDEGARLERAKLDNATPLLELCPTALVFGGWDSTSLKPSYLGAKFERAMVSEIVGYGVAPGKRTASRIDPLQIGANVTIYRTNSGGWTTDEASAAREKDQPARWQDGRPSTINHGNVLPSISDGGVTISHAIQTTVLSLIALRRLHFPLEKAKPNPESDLAVQTLLAALGLCAITYLRQEGCDLRSRCLLVPTAPSTFELLGSEASSVASFSLAAPGAVKLFEQAVKAATEAKFNWPAGDIALTPSKELIELIKKSRELAGKEA